MAVKLLFRLETENLQKVLKLQKYYYSNYINSLINTELDNHYIINVEENIIINNILNDVLKEAFRNDRKKPKYINDIVLLKNYIITKIIKNIYKLTNFL